MQALTVLMFLTIRAAHVLVAGLWIGSTVFGALWLMPALEATGPSGGQVMGRLARSGYPTYMSIIGLTTLLSGIYLLWHFTGGFDPAVAATHAGIAFGTGGAAGIVAGVIGGAVVGRSARQLGALSALASRPIEDPARGLVVQHAARLRRRVKIGTEVVIALQLTALVSMAIGHYV